ncbi:hypothetical protein NFI96_029551 [Prochilodus magdalenae]|nr:hypothetical protein NFI96_029551 [Prochilodus magdalenae]
MVLGEALDWANAVWSTYERRTYTDFIPDFRAVFDHPVEGRETGDQLFQLQQGSRLLTILERQIPRLTHCLVCLKNSDCVTIDKPILESRMLLSPIRWEIDSEIEQCNAAEPVPETCPPD